MSTAARLEAPPGPRVDPSAPARLTLHPGRLRSVTPRVPILELLIPVLIVLAWQVGVWSGMLRPQIFSDPIRVAGTLGGLVTNGTLLADLLVTLQRIVLGFTIGVSAGLGLGILTGYSRFGERLLDPTIHGLRSVPAIAWIPFLILWLGIDDAPKIALVSIATFFPVYVNTYAGIRSTDQKLIELARAYRLPRSTVVTRIVLPSAVPQILVGVRLAAGISWVAAIFAEIVAGNEGLGVLLNDGRSLGRPDQMIAVMLVLAICGKATDSLIRGLERRLTGWRSTFDGVAAEARPTRAAIAPVAT
jgi:ABC-type nitrate/sulfonate/bicarbonate transport system permease component